MSPPASKASYCVDSNNPRAPSEEVWEAMSAEERARVVDALPSEYPSAAPLEGDPHFEAKAETKRTLRSHFERIGRKVYLACELPVYYPNEDRFAPDVMAVLDVPTHQRMRWVVSHEGKGLDLALEVHVAGNRRKDLEANVERYARLGIREYFIFDRGRLRLSGYRLEEGKRVYRRIVPQEGYYASEVLGLDLGVVEEKLRFFYGKALVPEADEMIAQLGRMMQHAEEHRAEEARQLEEETQRREEAEQKLAEEARMRAEEARMRAEEARMRAEAEKRLAEALAEIERLRRER